MRARRASTLPDGMAEGCESYLTRVRSLLSRERTRIVAGGRALLALRPCLCRANKWLHDLVARGHVIADRRRVVCAMTYFPRLTRPSAAPSCVVHERCARQNCVSCNLRVCARARVAGRPCPRCAVLAVWVESAFLFPDTNLERVSFVFNRNGFNDVRNCRSEGRPAHRRNANGHRHRGTWPREGRSPTPSRSLTSPISAVDEHRRVRYRRQGRFWSLRDLLLDRGVECEA